MNDKNGICKIFSIILLCIFCLNVNSFAQDGEKSPTKAFFLSFVFPGLGERYVHSKGISNYLIISEVMMWCGYFGFKTYSNWLEGDYKNFAVTHALLNKSGKTKQFYVDIGNFNTVYDYNNTRRVQRDFERIYPGTADYFWEWDSRENRKKFEKMRIRKDTYENRAIFFVSGAILNRLVSAIEAAYLARREENRIKKTHLSFNSTPSGIILKLNYLF